MSGAELLRLDVAMVRVGLAPSRTYAQELIRRGHVWVDGTKASKTSQKISEQAVVQVDGDDGYASRGAYKLESALAALGTDAPPIAGRRVLDAGASAGGFTDVVLRHGAAEVVAVDVGHGQLIARLAHDPRVQVRDGINIRYLEPADVAPAPDLVVGDLSFISLTLVIPAVARCVRPDGHWLLMVKPQFEVGPRAVGGGGVVRNLDLHAQAIGRVLRAAHDAALQPWAVAPSALPGPAGNIEYFLAMSGPQAETPLPILRGDKESRAIQRAIAARPAATRGGE
ncbi:MAG: TlyA family RNA methyltransferase [Bowdeniella nasicola]|nr:TlyA family RNA methyltransferase [Bowdeniella nasicola]